MKQYFLNIARVSSSLLHGLKITLRHFWQARKLRTPVGVEDKTYFTQKDGIVTLQYPKEELPVPDTGRYQLHNEIDDCIVCDKCAKICPVNCIDIEPVRAVEEIGKTSDGTSKRIYAAKFDIDMSKCCFCGLCTVVCPTECLTMTNEYDFSVFDLKEHNFEFGEMSPELIAEKKAEFEAHTAEKEKAKAAAAAAKTASEGGDELGAVDTSVKPKPAGGFKPKVKIAKPAMGKSAVSPGDKAGAEEQGAKAKPVFKPKVKPVTSKKDETAVGTEGEGAKAAKPVFKPKIKPVVKQSEGEEGDKPKAARPVFKPKVKPAMKKTEDESSDGGEKPKAAKPVFKPKIKPVIKQSDEDKPEASGEEKKARAVFRPKIKPKKKD